MIEIVKKAILFVGDFSCSELKLAKQLKFDSRLYIIMVLCL